MAGRGFSFGRLASAFGFDGVSRDPSDSRIWSSAMSGAAISMAGQAVSAASCEQLDVVQAILARLGGTISTLPINVVEHKDGESVPVHDHWLTALLAAPNPRQTGQEFRDEVAQQLGFWRNALCEIAPGAGEQAVEALEPIHFSRVQRIERRTDDHIYYTVAELAPATGSRVLRDDEVWHIRRAPLTPDGLRGRFMWETGRETFGRAIAVAEFGATYFRNGGSGGGVLKHPGKFNSKEDQKDFLETWREGGTGVHRHRDRLLLQGVDYAPFSVNNDEAQFIETVSAWDHKLCRLWNMPPHMVGIMDASTNNNIEQQSIEYGVYTVPPWTMAQEQAAKRDFLLRPSDTNLFLEHDFAALMRGDLRARMMAYALGRQWGWLSANDVRRALNMLPIDEGGDTYLSPTNMVPAQTLDPENFDTTTPPAKPAGPSTTRRAQVPAAPARNPDPEQAMPHPVLQGLMSSASGAFYVAQILGGERLFAVSEAHLAREMRSGESSAAAPTAISVIPLFGALSPRGANSMASFRARLAQAAGNSDVAAIVIDGDSPGGTVAGTAETGAAVAAAAAIKPVYAIADTLSASAAYWIMSQASQFWATPSAEVGSIGVKGMHADVSRMLDEAGVTLTELVSAGSPYKTELSPFAPLGEDAKAHVLAQADREYEGFVRAVATGRKVSQTKVRDEFGKGRTVGAQDALGLGMIDRVGTMNDLLAAIRPKSMARPARRSSVAFA